MQTTYKSENQEEWIRILGKGMITIPKLFREKMGFKEGDIARIRKVGKSLVIEQKDAASYRIYTKKEIQEFLEDDKLSPDLARKAAEFWNELK